MFSSVPTSLLTAQRKHKVDSLGSLAYQGIKERIVTLQMPPASVIDESLLAQDLEIGLTPVRQALRQLAMERLVVIYPRRGTLVADLNLSDLQKIFEMRIELEGMASRLAAERALPTQIAELERMCAAVAASLANEDGDAPADFPSNQLLIQSDRQIHALIARASGNEFLAETLGWLYSHVLRLWYLTIERVGNLESAMQEHAAIVQAIKAGDGDSAAVLMRDHVYHFQQEFRSTI